MFAFARIAAFALTVSALGAVWAANETNFVGMNEKNRPVEFNGTVDVRSDGTHVTLSTKSLLLWFAVAKEQPLQFATTYVEGSAFSIAENCSFKWITKNGSTILWWAETRMIHENVNATVTWKNGSFVVTGISRNSTESGTCNLTRVDHNTTHDRVQIRVFVAVSNNAAIATSLLFPPSASLLVSEVKEAASESLMWDVLKYGGIGLGVTFLICFVAVGAFCLGQHCRKPKSAGEAEQASKPIAKAQKGAKERTKTEHDTTDVLEHTTQSRNISTPQKIESNQGKTRETICKGNAKPQRAPRTRKGAEAREEGAGHSAAAVVDNAAPPPALGQAQVLPQAPEPAPGAAPASAPAAAPSPALVGASVSAPPPAVAPAPIPAAVSAATGAPAATSAQARDSGSTQATIADSVQAPAADGVPLPEPAPTAAPPAAPLSPAAQAPKVRRCSTPTQFYGARFKKVDEKDDSHHDMFGRPI